MLDRRDARAAPRRRLAFRTEISKQAKQTRPLNSFRPARGRRHYRGDYPGEGGHRWNFMPRQCGMAEPPLAGASAAVVCVTAIVRKRFTTERFTRA